MTQCLTIIFLVLANVSCSFAKADIFQADPGTVINCINDAIETTQSGVLFYNQDRKAHLQMADAAQKRINARSGFRNFFAKYTPILSSENTAFQNIDDELGKARYAESIQKDLQFSLSLVMQLKLNFESYRQHNSVETGEKMKDLAFKITYLAGNTDPYAAHDYVRACRGEVEDFIRMTAPTTERN